MQDLLQSIAWRCSRRYRSATMRRTLAEDQAAARGIVNGLLLSAILWGLVAVAVMEGWR